MEGIEKDELLEALKVRFSDAIYLKEIFSGKNKDDLFSAHDGFYELYYPVHIDGKIIVLYFSDRERFGKYGS